MSNYYVKQAPMGLFELRQKRFRGKKHPHDIVAVARSLDELSRYPLTGVDEAVREFRARQDALKTKAQRKGPTKAAMQSKLSEMSARLSGYKAAVRDEGGARQDALKTKAQRRGGMGPGGAEMKSIGEDTVFRVEYRKPRPGGGWTPWAEWSTVNYREMADDVGYRVREDGNMVRIVEVPRGRRQRGWKKIKTLTARETAEARSRMGLDREGLQRSRGAEGCKPGWTKQNGMYVHCERGIVIEKKGSKWEWATESGSSGTSKTLKAAKAASMRGAR